MVSMVSIMSIMSIMSMSRCTGRKASERDVARMREDARIVDVMEACRPGLSMEPGEVRHAVGFS